MLIRAGRTLLLKLLILTETFSARGTNIRHRALSSFDARKASSQDKLHPPRYRLRRRDSWQEGMCRFYRTVIMTEQTGFSFIVFSVTPAKAGVLYYIDFYIVNERTQIHMYTNTNGSALQIIISLSQAVKMAQCG